MARLTFNKMSDEEYYIANDKLEFLGAIRRIRVGRFMQWCLCPASVPKLGMLWFSPGCQDEIREKCRKLKSEELKKNKSLNTF